MESRTLDHIQADYRLVLVELGSLADSYERESAPRRQKLRDLEVERDAVLEAEKAKSPEALAARMAADTQGIDDRLGVVEHQHQEGRDALVSLARDVADLKSGDANTATAIGLLGEAVADIKRALMGATGAGVKSPSPSDGRSLGREQSDALMRQAAAELAR